ncbi:metalloprotease MEP1 [Paecilomyces variotii No. 5]|uniref:Metalloprotease MEP1 n=1 Tax=Byssochlamys spectabilis (strain No. 5 / NBRC 109023) TaxID=1356009 RepID=V5FHX6_BYSSN|nr:metalloprotease MEP1 [Paecilomyces variotii No. 5]
MQWLVRFICLTLTFAYTLADGVTLNRGRYCGTSDPGAAFKALQRQLGSIESQARMSGTGNLESLAPIEIDTWFHIVSTKAHADSVTDKMISNQLSYLQNSYANTTMAYKLRGVTHSINDTWAQGGDDIGMKTALRKGTYSTLNIYFQTDLQDTPSDSILGRSESSASSNAAMPSLLGFCSLPDPNINSTSTRSDYIKDGCNILAGSMPGGPLTHYNRGGTAVHEVGHWNGLLHVFQGGSCSSSNEGDYIADTPIQSEPTDGCPARKDSCPDSAGLDSIHNFMDYSNDDCYQGFTKDQALRMRSTWAKSRQGK